LKKRIVLCIIFICLGAIAAWSQQQITDRESVYSFAEWLFARGEYSRAAGEYLRYLFLSENRSDPAVWYKIGLCYRYEGDYHKAAATFTDVLKTADNAALRGQLSYELAYCYFSLELYQESLAVIDRAKEDGVQNPGLLLLLETAGSLCLKQWQSALLLSNSYLEKPGNEYGQIALEFQSLAQSGSTFPQKSPVFAGILSAVIPGSGKIYAGRFMDGLFSLLTVGILSGMAVYSFYDEGGGSVRGWIYTGVGGIFYLGNIYGSVTAAQIYNKEQEEKIILKVRHTVGAGLP